MRNGVPWDCAFGDDDPAQVAAFLRREDVRAGLAILLSELETGLRYNWNTHRYEKPK